MGNGENKENLLNFIKENNLKNSIKIDQPWGAI